MSKSGKVATPEDVLSFWFEDLTPEAWFKKSDETDKAIIERFAATHLALAKERPNLWIETPEAHLALILVLDQFPRNIYRDTPLAFATDLLALREARRAIDLGHDRAVADDRRVFFYLPFEHSENLADQNRSVALIERLGNDVYTDDAQRHRAVIAEFGRFPHRNAILGRSSAPSELNYLAKPGAGF